jgi:hypothetical protein
LVLLDMAGPVPAQVGASRDVQLREEENCQPVERMRADIPREDWYLLVAEHVRGNTSWLDIDVMGRDGSFDQSQPDRSLAEPAVHSGVFAVGAVRAENYLTTDIEDFSSWGPTHGGLDKPDIAGPDGLSTDAFGPNGFFGTSASAPAVTALLALVMEEDRTRTPADAAEVLKAHAWGDSIVGARPDPRWGAGKARLPVRDAKPQPCGRRPLVMPIFLFLPMWARRRRGVDGKTRQELP